MQSGLRALAAALVPLSLLVCASVQAEESNLATEPDAAASPARGNLIADFPTKYYWRGFPEEDDGFIFQPWANLIVPVYQREPATGLCELALNFGTFHSFHSGPTGTSGEGVRDPRSWFEADILVGGSARIDDRLTLATAYVIYASPNGSFSSIHELDFNLSYEDRSHWPFAWSGLRPSVTLAFETKHQSDPGNRRGVYLQLGVAPRFELMPKRLSFRPVAPAPAVDALTLEVQSTVGLSLDEYYEDAQGDDDTFGYFDLGPTLLMPLGFVPARYGRWTASAGVHLLWLGDSMKSINNRDGFEVLALFRLQLDF